MGDTSNTRVSWGNKDYYNNSSLRGVFQIKNNDSNKYYNQIGLYEHEGLTHIEGVQGFNFYFKRNIDKYYLTLEVWQRATCGGGCIQGGALFLNFGKGIKLYK